MNVKNGIKFFVLVWSWCDTTGFEMYGKRLEQFNGFRNSRQHNMISSIPSSILHSRGIGRKREEVKMIPDLISIDSSTIMMNAAVEVFDGSTIVDPVVVSNAFYASFASKLFSLLLGQLLAGILFSFLASLVATQLPKLGEIVSTNIFKQLQQTPSSTNNNNNNNDPTYRNDITVSEYKQPINDNR